MQTHITAIFLLLSMVPGASTTLSAEGISGWGSKITSIFSKSSDAVDEDAVFASAEELARALREALAVSAERALADLGRAGGFADSERFRIPLPKAVESFRKPLALANRDYLIDDFQATMNRAAEQGVAASPEIVKNAIQSLTIEDLNDLWKGGNDAITRFLEKRSRDQLAERMLPLISEATDATGATRTYKQMESALPEKTGGFLSKVRSFTGIGGKTDFDLDNYVNKHALDALFAAMAAEEKSIRENPMARTTDLLKKLFGN